VCCRILLAMMFDVEVFLYLSGCCGDKGGDRYVKLQLIIMCACRRRASV